MDIRIRRNELCSIGLPRCDYVFSSSRSCFIGYGFKESTLEMTILRNLLEKRGIEAVEAAGTLAPGQNVFCAKICSKIITSQFCIVLLNNDVRDGIEMPNANVNMEYGLMLGFNKYTIPFQRASQRLPFNVAGLDTIKYESQSLESLARSAIDEAIAATTQGATSSVTPDQAVQAFLLSQRLLMSPILTDGDRNLYELGRPLGFNLVVSFDGMQYGYFGNFTNLRPEIVFSRLTILRDIVAERAASIPERVRLGVATLNPVQLAAITSLLRNLKGYLLVTSDADRDVLKKVISEKWSAWPVGVFSLNDVSTELNNVG